MTFHHPGESYANANDGEAKVDQTAVLLIYSYRFHILHLKVYYTTYILKINLEFFEIYIYIYTDFYPRLHLNKRQNKGGVITVWDN